MSRPATGTLTDHIQQFRHNGPPGTREAHCFARTAFQASGLRAVQRHASPRLRTSTPGGNSITEAGSLP